MHSFERLYVLRISCGEVFSDFWGALVLAFSWVGGGQYEFWCLCVLLGFVLSELIAGASVLSSLGFTWAQKVEWSKSEEERRWFRMGVDASSSAALWVCQWVGYVLWELLQAQMTLFMSGLSACLWFLYVLRITCPGDCRSFVLHFCWLWSVWVSDSLGVWGFSVSFEIFEFWVLCWAYDGSLGFELHGVHFSSKSWKRCKNET